MYTAVGMQQNKKHGFTIVELLIVIVVIAILAAITIVAYTGIQDRAKASAMQSSASQAGKTIAAYAVSNNDTYPATLAAAGLASTTDVSYTYIVNNTTTPKNYCLSATDTSNPTIAYAFTSTSAGVIEGECVTNLFTNPSFESGPVWSTNSGVGIAMNTTEAYMEDQSMRLVRNGTGDDFAYQSITLQSGHTYSYSVWTYLTGSGSTGNNRNYWLYNQSGGTPTVDMRYGSPYNSWRLLSDSYTPTNASLTSRIYPVPGQTLYVDGLLIVESNNVYAYGSSGLTGWAWNGTENASTSFGPALRQ